MTGAKESKRSGDETARLPASGRLSDDAGVLLHCFIGAVSADSAWLISWNGRNGDARVLSGWDPNLLGGPQRWLGGDFLGRLRDGGDAIFEPGRDGAGPDGDGRSPVRHALGSPVRPPSGPVAALCAGYRGAPDLQPGELLWTARSFAAVAALYLSDSGGFTRAVAGSLRDSLTGCLGYAALMAALENEIDRSMRRGHRLSICFLDLDGFKRVNETAGHMAGNRVLAAAGAALRQQVRAYDIVGRFGGDEFLVVLPETGASSADKLAWRLCARVQDATRAADAGSADLHVSIGVAEWAHGVSPVELLEHADRSLRLAKQRSGSTVVVGWPPGVEMDTAFDHASELVKALTSRVLSQPPENEG